ncbi:hypothetical protein D6D27_07498 [Aureobasidium pullulans]|nr:hypothetical protein D6D27_07498 [Aureobasidium pullulans]
MTDSALQIVAVCSSVASAGSLTSMTTMTCLATLPTEISHMISSYIDDADLDTMRLVNREVRDSVTDEWAKRNITERNHTVSFRGLKALVDISRHPIFASYLRILVFNVFYSYATKLSDRRLFMEEKVGAYTKQIFANLAANQTGHVTVGFSDNFPSIWQSACVSSTFYRCSEKPSYGWQKMMAQMDDGTRRSKRRQYLPCEVSRFGFATMGQLAGLVLPIARASNCLIAGLEIRIVGLFCMTQWPFSAFQPAFEHQLADITQWDVRVVVVEDKYAEARDDEMSSVIYQHATKKLTFNRFVLGPFHSNSIYCSVYEIFLYGVGKKIKQLEIYDSWIARAESFCRQLARMFQLRGDRSQEKEDAKAYEGLNQVLISGLWVADDRGWDEILARLAAMDHVKQFSLHGAQTALAANSVDHIVSNALQLRGEVEMRGGQGYQGAIGIDRSILGNLPIARQMSHRERLHDAINNLNLDLDTDRGDDIQSVLLAMANDQALTDTWRL